MKPEVDSHDCSLTQVAYNACSHYVYRNLQLAMRCDFLGKTLGNRLFEQRLNGSHSLPKRPDRPPFSNYRENTSCENKNLCYYKAGY